MSWLCVVVVLAADKKCKLEQISQIKVHLTKSEPRTANFTFFFNFFFFTVVQCSILILLLL